MIINQETTSNNLEAHPLKPPKNLPFSGKRTLSELLRY
jgi:hypothetical protein